ncbi:MAG: hypothetical protein KME35_05200 [Aphanocapsa sp. GSE-SYN-MK-11-07L]|nr:hypothetical protein [Aphanocapsa sp. GSE-SYN-MK-11-07L]
MSRFIIAPSASRDLDRIAEYFVALNFRNLFNINYFEGSLGSNVYPAVPFTVQGTVSWKF